MNFNEKTDCHYRNNSVHVIIKCWLIDWLVLFKLDVRFMHQENGIHRMCGSSYAISRASAAVVMFTYSSLLVVMCRNTITFLRDTRLRQYIPFDGAISMHKYIAFWSAIFTGQLCVHIVAKRVNVSLVLGDWCMRNLLVILRAQGLMWRHGGHSPLAPTGRRMIASAIACTFTRSSARRLLKIKQRVEFY